MNTKAPRTLPGFQREGNTAYVTDNVQDVHTLTITGRPTSFHVKVEILPGKEPTLRRILFGEKSERIVDAVATWTRAELATAFETWRIGDTTDDAFAVSRGAQFGIPDKFIRTGDQVIFLGPIFEEGGGNISVLLTEDDIKPRMTLFLRTGQANPVAS